MRSAEGRHLTDMAPGNRAARHLTLAALAALPVVALLSASIAGRPASAVMAGTVFLASAAITARGLQRGYPHDRLGLCNLVTLVRAALAATLAGLLAAPQALAHPATAWAAVGVATIALMLDGVDGIAAHRSGLASSFGARFDMEVDALLALTLSLLALQAGKAGPWVLALGTMRYAFVVATWIWPWLGGPLPERFRRKTICVIQIGALIALIAPVVTPPLSTGIAATVMALVAWSFAVDILWLRRRRA
jgi:phosphatidylglycerophosphate synthase